MSSAAGAAASGPSPKRLVCGVGAAGVTDSAAFAGFGFAGTPPAANKREICLSMFSSWVGPRSVTSISSLPLTCR